MAKPLKKLVFSLILCLEKTFDIFNVLYFRFIIRIVNSWTEEKDTLMMREMAAQGIFQFKAGSRERGKVWEVIAKNLNKNRDLFKAATARGVRDRFTLILRRHKAKNADELRATGAGSDDEQGEYDQLLEELGLLYDESDKKAEEAAQTAKEKVNEEKEVAMDIRKRAMETMGQTSKRKTSDDLEDDEIEIKGKKKRRSGSDTLSWLEKKAERDSEFRELQLEEQRKERESQQKERREQLELMQKQLQMQSESQQQQQQQQMMLIQQVMGIMQQQQQQLQLLASKKD